LNNIINQDEIIRKIKEQCDGLRAKGCLPDILEAIKKHHQGITPYQMTEQSSGEHVIPYLTFRRAEKICKYADTILNIIGNIDEIEAATEPETLSIPFDVFSESSASSGMEVTETSKGVFAAPNRAAAKITKTIDQTIEQYADSFEGLNGRTRYLIYEELTQKIPKDKWTIKHLQESVFIGNRYDYLNSTDEHALDFLLEYDTLTIHAEQATKNRNTISNEGVTTDSYNYMVPFNGFQRLVEMFNEYSIREANPEIRSAWVDLATSLITRGIITSNVHLEIAGENVARYQLWKEENMERYFESLRGFCPTLRIWQNLVSSIKRKIVAIEFSKKEVRNG